MDQALPLVGRARQSGKWDANGY